MGEGQVGETEACYTFALSATQTPPHDPFPLIHGKEKKAEVRRQAENVNSQPPLLQAPES